MKQFGFSLLILSTIAYAEGASHLKTGASKASAPTSHASTTGFFTPFNTQHEDDDDINTRLKSSTHMGDILNNDLPVFGQNLFGNQCSQQHQAHFFNPHYRLSVGDEVDVQMWGAYQLSKKFTVDTQGNIFIPEVGPVKLAGIENEKLNTTIQQHVKKVFKKGVNVYADLVTAQPIQVFVTGFVNSPGLYDGLSSDSIIYFLCAAGGINLHEGSFREIVITREGKEIRRVDLYSFLLRGDINPFQLHQGDTIVVKPQKYTISVAGNVKKPYQYELRSQNISLASLKKLANVEPSSTYVRIQRNQGMKPKFHYLPISQSNSIMIQAGDRVTFVADKEIHQRVVTVKGQVKGQHQYIVKPGTTLAEFLNTLQLKPDANLDNVQLFRESVAKEQKEALNTNLSRLKRQAMTGESLTGDDAKIHAARSELISKFIDEAQQAETKGQIVLGDRALWKKIILENNDTINIPAKTSIVTVSGDVVNSVSINANPQYRLADYIQAAGGFQKSANQKEFLLIKQNGQIQNLKYDKYAHYPIEGGDQLVVLPNETDSGLKVTGMMTGILYQLAIAARVAMRI
ncbi:polysaccharide biosynthesis/export family protein [Legionella impletisoli]|uniref:Polysialic acid transporter n=1 Tax=Legionella impletisoli TaxID=343510 RepID=A0A917N8D1_9GAMM|nr:polysaccharide biosynthesis/export family protein [Legionella impletisoli]GGI77235.1 polysialic acid transporter [Legionella impletisoli]